MSDQKSNDVRCFRVDDFPNQEIRVPVLERHDDIGKLPVTVA